MKTNIFCCPLILLFLNVFNSIYDLLVYAQAIVLFSVVMKTPEILFNLRQKALEVSC